MGASSLGLAAERQRAVALLRKTQEQGQVRVIVGLDFDLREEEQLTAAERQAQARMLEGTQNSVARRAVVPSDQIVRLETIPYMSAFVTRRQLERLLSDPQVVSIQAAACR